MSMVLWLLTSSAMAGQPLTLEIVGLQSTDGQVLVAVHTSADTFPGDAKGAVFKAVAKPTMPTTTVTFDDVPPGTYAAVAVHDENGNGELDVRRIIPIPKEPIACSRDAKGTFGPPKFDDAKFTMPDAAHTERFTIGKIGG